MTKGRVLQRGGGRSEVADYKKSDKTSKSSRPIMIAPRGAVEVSTGGEFERNDSGEVGRYIYET